jgi:transketolase
MAELSMREAYGRALAEYGDLNPSVLALDVDTAASTLSSFFASRFPDRFSISVSPNPAWWMSPPGWR